MAVQSHVGIIEKSLASLQIKFEASYIFKPSLAERILKNFGAVAVSKVDFFLARCKYVCR